MTATAVEDVVRRTLEAWADDLEPTPPRPGAVRRRVAVRRRRRVVRGTGVAVVVLGLVAGVGVAGRDDGTTSVVADAPPTDTGSGDDANDAGAGGGSAGGSGITVGDPALFVLDPPWELVHATMGLDLDGQPPDYTADLRFENGTRTVEVVSYTLGSRGGGADDFPLVVRGFPARTFEMAVGEVRVGWDEGGVTFEATGNGFPDVQTFVAELSSLRIVDEAEYAAVLPEGVGNGLVVGVRSFPLDAPGYVTWNRGDAAVECNIDGVGPPHPVDPVNGC